MNKTYYEGKDLDLKKIKDLKKKHQNVILLLGQAEALYNGNLKEKGDHKLNETMKLL